MMGFSALWRRNQRLFFKDKGMFFSSMITPIILLVLYATFLANVYKDAFLSGFPKEMSVDAKLIDAAVGGQLISSLLAVSCVTVAFCSNLLMINDRANGTFRDLTVTPVKRSTLAFAYYAASAASTLIITLTASVVGLGYLATKGWYLSAADVAELFAAVILLTLFGTALSSCIHFFLSTAGQASAVGTIISAGYGFICGAYMPISSFSKGLQKVLSCLPGTYGTSLLRNLLMHGTLNEMEKIGLPKAAVDELAKTVDCSPEFFGHSVSTGAMFIILAGSVVLFTGIFVVLNIATKKVKIKD